MTRPRFSLSELAKTSIAQYILRFAIGGLVSLVAGLLTKLAGPSVGGLFLAFPALLPASLTLIGQRDGHQGAYEDARGACLGSVAFIIFAAVVWGTALRIPGFLVLTAALAAWFVVGLCLWWWRFARPARSAGAKQEV